MVVAAGFALSAATGVARADIIPNSVISLSTTNDVWQHASYFVTGAYHSYYGASATLNTNGLSLDGFDDQNEVSLTVYADKRYGEIGNGYHIYPTFALAIMRNWRLRDSLRLKADPGNIDVFSLPTAATADSQSGLYYYCRDAMGATVTVQAGRPHAFEVKYSGERTYVYNDDSLAGKRPSFDTARGVPLRTDWLDIKDSSPVKGHVAYKWVALVDGVQVSSAWLDSDKGRVKFESNKRHLTYAPTNSTTNITNVRLATAGGTSGASAWRSWTKTVPAIVLTTKGCYLTRTKTAYTAMQAYVPGVNEVPKANFVKASGSIAYNLRSFQTTRFTTSVDRPNVWARLKILLPGGIPDRVIYDGPIRTANSTFWFPLWNGLDPNGHRLSSANYGYELRLTRNGISNYYVGKITVCRILFAIRGTSVGGKTEHHAAYMLPGNANCYVAARSAAPPDRLGMQVSGPGGMNTRLVSLGFPDTATVSSTRYLRSGTTVRTAGTYAFDVTGTNQVSYGMTVIQ